jgi:hypothetical protein
LPATSQPFSVIRRRGRQPPTLLRLQFMKLDKETSKTGGKKVGVELRQDNARIQASHCFVRLFLLSCLPHVESEVAFARKRNRFAESAQARNAIITPRFHQPRRRLWGDEKLARQRLVIPANSVARIVRPEAQSDFDSLKPRTEGKRKLNSRDESSSPWRLRL